MGAGASEEFDSEDTDVTWRRVALAEVEIIGSVAPEELVLDEAGGSARVEESVVEPVDAVWLVIATKG